MAVKFQKRHEKGADSFDPLCLEDFDWNNEWVDMDVEPVHNGHGLEITWDQVDEAVGASQMYHGHNFPRAARGDATYTHRRSAAAAASIRTDEPQEDEDMEDDNSDEEYLVDDVEVDDYGEIAPIVADESDQAAAAGGNSDPFVTEDDFY
jgi:hypothetical protein